MRTGTENTSSPTRVVAASASSRCSTISQGKYRPLRPYSDQPRYNIHDPFISVTNYTRPGPRYMEAKPNHKQSGMSRGYDFRVLWICGIGWVDVGWHSSHIDRTSVVGTWREKRCDAFHIEFVRSPRPLVIWELKSYHCGCHWRPSHLSIRWYTVWGCHCK